MAETTGVRSSGQERIWSHFQNRASLQFDASMPRLKWLVRWMKGDWRKPEQATILDIGVGNGVLEAMALEASFKVAALDPDVEVISRLTKIGVDARVGYAESLPFDDSAFDYVVASEVFEHLSDVSREASLVEIFRVLRPGGCLLITVPYDEDLALGEVVCPDCGKIFHRWGHQKSFTLPSLKEELAQYFPGVIVTRTAFVDFSGGLTRKIKSLMRLILAHFGQMIAVPSLFAICRKKV